MKKNKEKSYKCNECGFDNLDEKDKKEGIEKCFRCRSVEDLRKKGASFYKRGVKIN